MSGGLVEFLRARLDEDEGAARATPDDPFSSTYGMRFLSWESDHSDEDTAFVDRFNPARVLAEVEAKRRIVDREEKRLADLRWRQIDAFMISANSPLLLDLATVYADHPDYREEWKQ